jgi:dipeptidyl-peptidase-4
MRNLGLPLSISLLLAGALPATELSLDKIFAPASRPDASQAAWRPDGGLLTHVVKENAGSELRGIDPATGKVVWRLAYAELKTAPSAPAIAPSRYLWSPRSDALLFSDDSDLYLYRLADRSLKRLTETAAEEEEATFSPDGARVAYVRECNLFVRDLATGHESQLTADGKDNEILNGKNDWVYWEEIWNRKATGFWWSPDSQRIAYYRFDDRAVATYPLLDERGTYPEIRWQRYPKAGEVNPTVRIRVVDIATGTHRELATADTQTAGDAYLARVHWRPDNAKIAVERLNRDQTELDLLLCDPRSGDCEAIARRTSATWVNVSNEFHFLSDGGFLWTSEESGWNRLMRHDAKGKVVAAVSPETLAVTALDAVDEASGVAIVTGFRPVALGPMNRRVVLLELKSTPKPGTTGVRSRILASDAGANGANVAPGAQHWVHRWSDAHHPPTETLRTIGGETVVALPGPPAPDYDPAKLPQWEYFEIPGPNGVRLPARWLQPANFDARKRYPAIMFHYGGPASQVVTNSWDKSRGLWHRWMSERGYVVLMVDNEASIFFGKRGEDRVHRNFGPLELAGQLAGVEYLKSIAWVDSTRIGIWGWSGGGANTLWALFHSPGTWKAGVAGAPVADLRFYDSIWTERYMDTPQSNPEGYKSGSAISAAGALADALLVVHGTGDDNVHPQNSIVLIDKLVNAGIAFEDALYPREKHGFEPVASKHFYARMTEFFDRHLKPGS